MSKFIDISGQQFNSLLVIERYNSIGNKPTWLCQCICGKRTVALGTNLKNGGVKGCGCKKNENIGKANTKIFSGQKYNYLTVIQRRKDLETIRRTMWECQCDCGNIHIVGGGDLRSGNIKSCGCLQKELQRKGLTKHGLSYTKEYKYWMNRKRREQIRNLDFEWTLKMEKSLKKFQKTCIICGSKNKLCVDHVLPLSKGYGLKPGNAVILCSVHNNWKNNKLLNDLPSDIQMKLIKAAQEFRLHWENNQC